MIIAIQQQFMYACIHGIYSYIVLLVLLVFMFVTLISHTTNSILSGASDNSDPELDPYPSPPSPCYSRGSFELPLLLPDTLGTIVSLFFGLISSVLYQEPLEQVDILPSAAQMDLLADHLNCLHWLSQCAHYHSSFGLIYSSTCYYTCVMTLINTSLVF